MPELPEVETIRRGLEDHLIGRSISMVEIRVPKLFLGDPLLIQGSPIRAILRQGKLLILQFESAYVLTIHLKMTGQLIWKPAGKTTDAVMGGHPEKSYLEPLPHKHTHVIILFDDDSTLYFNDLRKFGRLQVVWAEELKDVKFLQTLGPEPLERGFTREYLRDRLKKKPRQVIKSFLLDQTNIAGLGNIYADESLFRAVILPDRLTGDLTQGEINNLFDAIQETLELAIQYGGSSSQNYVNAVGEKGTFLRISNVYHRQGKECNRCLEGIITRKKIGGRSSHYCPICQR